MRLPFFRFLFDNPGEVAIGGGGSGTGAATPPARVADEPATATRGVTCEFCECRLDSRGAVLFRGDEAKRFQQLEIAMEKATRELADLREDNRRLNEQIASTPKKSGLFG